MTEQPPPGWAPPEHPPAPAPPPVTAGYGDYGGAASAMPRPGVVALRPLALGDLYDGAFKTIRRNPRAMIGMGAVVTTAAMTVPVLVTLLLASSGGLSLDLLEEAAAGSSIPAMLGTGGLGIAGNLGTAFAAFAAIVLNGLLVRVVAEAVLGRRTGMRATWSSTRGRLCSLVALAALNVVVALLLVGAPAAVGVTVGLTVGTPAGLLAGLPLVAAGMVALAFVQVRFFQLAAPALVLERVGVLDSVRRAASLSRGQFWRLLGITLLTILVAGLVGQVIAVPLATVGVLGPFVFPGTGGALVLVFSTYLSQVVVGTLVTPFTSAVTALLYVDQRIRKEGLDVALIAAASRVSGNPR